MIEQKGDLWNLAVGNVLCITTNGFVKSNGSCVMGRGIAFSAAKKFPTLPNILGKKLKEGNKVHFLGLFDKYLLVSFPVKPIISHDSHLVVAHMKGKFTFNNTIPGWAAQANPEIIKESCKQLVQLATLLPTNIKIYLPRPGCGAGELTWETVKPILEEYLLEDRFIVCTF